MNSTFYIISVSDAGILLGIISTFVIPFLVGWLKRSTWPAQGKFALAVVVSIILGYLTLVSTSGIPSGATAIFFVSLLLNATQAIYFFIFKPLGIDAWLNPSTGEATTTVTVTASSPAAVSVEKSDTSVIDPPTE